MFVEMALWAREQPRNGSEKWKMATLISTFRIRQRWSQSTSEEARSRDYVAVYNEICQKLGTQRHRISTKTKKASLNYFLTYWPPPSNTWAQAIFLVSNCDGEWEMVPIRHYEAGKKMVGSRGNVNAESQTRSSSKEDYDLNWDQKGILH